MPANEVARWRGSTKDFRPGWVQVAGAKSGPRNVLIRRADGTLVVRPFRGLRRSPDSDGTSEGVGT